MYQQMMMQQQQQQQLAMQSMMLQQQQQQQLMLGMGQAGLVGVIPGMPQVGALGLGAAGGIGLLQAMPQAGALTLGAATAAVHDSSKSSGKLKSFLPDKGFGFISNDDGSEDLFFFQKELMNGDISELVAGMKLEFNVETDSRSGKPKATSVSIFGREVPLLAGRRLGKLKVFLPDKGFGFIENDDGGQDLFFFQKELTNGDITELVAGMRLEFNVEQDNRSGKRKATSVAIHGREAPNFVGRHLGRLKSYLAEKGFGFIEAEDGSKDLFLNHSDLKSGDVADLVVGAKLEYDIERETRSGKLKATNVIVVKST
eukprot:gnl/TRDRNA2_/TRDRNA2_173727_c1_seq2.p1 gnl/TRDRNA2_/TRDRNA2_173727_c1~~gnl/TRDRNA2_/TRDRNA2_173727_c1_seq2.p1  ORF type:complete len:314 (+),score=76.56 gnl/TRDRNA2_/TRDRNA2_173727_c1_seq2:2-943(+)